MIPTTTLPGALPGTGPQPDRTYRLSAVDGRLTGMHEGAEAVAQAMYLILNTERYEHVIYSRDYGLRLADLVGLDREYVRPLLRRRISSALLWDERIRSVEDFTTESVPGGLLCRFVAKTVYGEIAAQKEVAV